MKLLKPALTAVILMGSLVCANAWAQHGHGGGGHGGGHAGGHSGGHWSGAPGFGHAGHPGGGPRYVRGHGGRGWVGGVVLGAPLLWPRYGYGPYYDGYYDGDYVPGPAWYAPPELAPAGIPPGVAYWYYCDRPRGYYPSVGGCYVPWRVVTGRPAP